MKLHIKVIPSSSKDSITGMLEDTVKIKVKAPPEKGKANKAVIKILEKSLGLAKGSIKITSGTASSRKVIEITGADDETINKKLTDICNK
ncbi:MAG: YggU family protein [Gammaproteobacteria bacterium]|nr:YggU family protein [Gammaproteobacteria bacterium]